MARFAHVLLSGTLEEFLSGKQFVVAAQNKSDEGNGTNPKGLSCSERRC